MKLTSLKNPTGIKSVTVIVTHEDGRRDYSRTYMANQILSSGTYKEETTSEDGHRTVWAMQTRDDQEPDYAL